MEDAPFDKCWMCSCGTWNMHGDAALKHQQTYGHEPPTIEDIPD